MQVEVSVEAHEREDAGFEVAEAIKRSFDEHEIQPPRRYVDVRSAAQDGLISGATQA